MTANTDRDGTVARALGHGDLHPVRRLDAIIVAVVGALVAGFGFWIPNFWGDEEATHNAIDRPLGGLIEMVTQQVDAVHAVYYLLMMPWAPLVGVEPALLRLPSALLVGVAVAGTVVLGQRLVGRSAGILAGTVLFLLPAVTDMGIEARSYPWSVAVATWLTVVLLQALSDGRTRWWVGYGLLASLTIALFLNNALVIVAHGLAVLITRPGLRVLVRFVVATAVGALLASPVVLLSFGQRGQVGWIQEVGRHTAGQVLLEQWFRDAIGFAVVGWAIAIIVVVAGLTRARRLRPLLTIVLPWLLLPTTLLVLVSVVLPLYTPRYLATGAPALALLIGTGLSLVPWRVVRVVAVLGLAALTAGTYVAQRQPLRFATEWRETAAFLEERAQPGDALLFNDVAYAPSDYTRGTLSFYGDRLSAFDDVALLESHRSNGRLRDDVVDITTLEERLRDVDAIWVVWPDALAWDDSDIAEALRAAGLELTDATSLQYTELRYFERTP
ncbi:hypothetical protein ELQ92_01625 [Labedella populi]|uniref:Uncharacterized protein n=1 Tax=Labedella populi TaxID=2498850 RepID=A0A444QEH2_9MICO|nr:glycosyltransferase family 39 protein [Labedella populi]RWZ67986.1 hypothetical protein ELQ92_01625 [Labedella populi]